MLPTPNLATSASTDRNRKLSENDGGIITTGSVTANQVTLVPGDVGAGSAASSGSRMNITTSRIKIYDSGNLRVQLGDLS